MGGREVTGVLKGWDKRINIVLDNAVEKVRDLADPLTTTEQTREIGFVVCRSTAVATITPVAGMKEIENPFVQPSE
jgi:U6 snRNA-associated Sm-like protein LSm7